MAGLKRFIVTGQMAVLVGLVSLVGAKAETGNRFQIEGLAPGDKVQLNSKIYADYKCGASKFEPDVYCTRVKRDADVQRANTTTAILHRPSGEVLYISNTMSPVTLSGHEIDSEIDHLNREFGSQPHVVMPPDNVRSEDDAALVTWGNIRLRPIDAALRQTIMAGGTVNQGFLVDHLNDLKKSIAAGLPVYQIEGGRGFVLSANWDRSGRGTLVTRSIDQAALQPDIDKLVLNLSQLQADVRGDFAKLKGAPQSAAAKAQIAALNDEFNKPDVSSDRAKLQGLRQRLNALAAEPAPAAPPPSAAAAPIPPPPPAAVAVPVPPPPPPAQVVVPPPPPPQQAQETVQVEATAKARDQVEAATKARDDAVRAQGELKSKVTTETKARADAEARLKAEAVARQKAETEAKAAYDDFQRALVQVEAANADRQQFQNYFFAALMALGAVLLGGCAAIWSLLRRQAAPAPVAQNRYEPNLALSAPATSAPAPTPFRPNVSSAPTEEVPPIAARAVVDEAPVKAGEVAEPKADIAMPIVPDVTIVQEQNPVSEEEEPATQVDEPVTRIETPDPAPKSGPQKRSSSRKGGNKNAKTAGGGSTPSGTPAASGGQA